MFVPVLVGGAAVASGGAYAVHKKYEFENPSLLLALPFSIVRNQISPVQHPKEFTCPHRQELHEHCTKAGSFDQMTVPPVNTVLHKKGIPLSKDALYAIKDDIDHSTSLKSDATAHEKIQHYKQQSANQRRIGDAFMKSQEPEGAFMHHVLSGFFAAKATISQTFVDHVNHMEKQMEHGGPDYH
ncbi:Uncharacterised protein [Legionella sainthelensi]|uniref:Uncharacterized protein n=1 Tax=Legionella sainthelensi TaxID=28087 RepID=A0A2H5FGX6_9GAMM|nr:hypothetical protein [Legionella sainthelensi]AUH70777.1 hypothetical protein CAB17_00955 [Legionella sainthelensi]VEB38246.1 Uncharacterised protein [Legionella sainthelensi]